ncbi:hypothetical protein PINS_up007415 [Pythium insidiosum]|nr:hypothetical protein PINS_up007415 [Pythium insidiosum]
MASDAKRARHEGRDDSKPRHPRVRQGFTAFNMDDENEEGHFDEDGHFIWKREEKAVQEEAWLDGVDEDSINAARSAKACQQETDDLTEEEANRILATLLQPRETVLQALRRLGKKRSKPRAGNKRKHADNGHSTEAPAQTVEEKEQFERITEAADFLMRIGEIDVYSQMKEEFVSEEELLAQRQAQQQQRERLAAETATSSEESKSEEHPPPTKDEVMWEYKGADGQIHGPFSTSAFIAWQQQVCLYTWQ